MIPTTPEPPPALPSEPTSPSGSGSPQNARSQSPVSRAQEWNGEGAQNRTPDRDNLAHGTPTQTQNNNQNHNQRNTPATNSTRERRTPRRDEEQNGNRLPNGSQARRANRTNRNRNSIMPSERRNDNQPSDLPRGYGKYKQKKSRSSSKVEYL